MKISARNILKGNVEKVAEGAVNGVVTIKVGNDTVKADITMEAIASRQFQRAINYLEPLSQ